MITTNSRYALVGYFITSYPTRAHGIIVLYFIRILRLKFAKFEEYFKNKAEAEILKRIDIILCVDKYSAMLCF